MANGKWQMANDESLMEKPLVISPLSFVFLFGDLLAWSLGVFPIFPV